MNKRVLIVDDEPDVNLAVKIVLEENGFQVDTFTDPFLALENFRKKAGMYDLLMLDIKMPNMNGFELSAKIREADPDVKICFITAVSEFTEYEQYKKEAYPRLGERHFVAKPVSDDELIRRVNEILK